MDDDFDIEVIEAHHRHKVDAPSGTALMLGEAAAEGRGVDLNVVKNVARDGITGARTRGDIGFSAVRGGDIVGEHKVSSFGYKENIYLTHQALDREVFASGSINLGLKLMKKKKGFFSVQDLI